MRLRVAERLVHDLLAPPAPATPTDRALLRELTFADGTAAGRREGGG
ncbi:hypothetical protein [Streptomyces rubellomurinus]|nr:hypothetical protein [Streptomyces rubellomurinus]